MLERYADTTGWRLDLPDLFAGMDGKHRTSCRKARKEGVTVRIQPGPADLGAFVELYEETMRRLGPAASTSSAELLGLADGAAA